VNVGNNARNCKQVPESVVVSKVGRKYFSCERADGRGLPVQFYIDGWRENTNYTANNKLYIKEQHWRDEVEFNKLHGIIRDKFSLGGGSKKLTLEQLRDIHKIIAR
jgi:hypothetical protein